MIGQDDSDIYGANPEYENLILHCSSWQLMVERWWSVDRTAKCIKILSRGPTRIGQLRLGNCSPQGSPPPMV